MIPLKIPTYVYHENITTSPVFVDQVKQKTTTACCMLHPWLVNQVSDGVQKQIAQSPTTTEARREASVSLANFWFMSEPKI
mmetsp:Transcript_40515/g.108679  ORF Transcript_40515/g.108679 Transcript_40515/m.108679 type:complete len:81 (+) Transcript_40515:413-655(+)